MKEIDEVIVAKLVVALHHLDKTPAPITLFINSPGGAAYDSFALYDELMMAESEVQTIGIGHVMSAAVPIFLAGKRRVLSPNCRLMIHNGSWDIGEAHSSVVIAKGHEQWVTNKQYAQIIADRSGAKIKRIMKLCDQETYLSAQEAIAEGFADGLYRRQS